MADPPAPRWEGRALSIDSRLRELLDQHQATYAVLPDPPAVPQPATGAPWRPATRTLARAAVIRQGSGLSLAVLPVSSRVDLARLSAALRDQVGLADEREIASAFPDCEGGAVPPFGVLFGLKTYLDESLTHDRHIHFSAGTRAETIRMPFEEYRRVAAPVVLWLAQSLAEAEG